MDHRFSVFCFSASLTSFCPFTARPFRTLTASIYLFATFSLSASSPRSSSSSSVNGTQNGSSSSISKPWNTSWGDAAPDVRLRISSLKPNDSATGSTDRIVKKGVPSLRDSEIIRPRRRVITLYTRPRTSAGRRVSFYCLFQHGESPTGRLNLATVHGKKKSRAPVQKALSNRVSYRLNNLTCESAKHLPWR